MYKDIIVCVNEADGRDNAIRAAARLAKEIDATLTALYVRIDDTPAIGMYGYVTADLVAESKRLEDKHVADVKADFEKIVQELDFSASWLEVSEKDNPLRAIAYADLVITNQAAYDPRRGQSNVAFINNLILETGKPIILVPTEWTASSFGDKVIVGWDESREASRAIHDAMPLLQKADSVEVLTINHDNNDKSADVYKVDDFLNRRNVNSKLVFAATDNEYNSTEKVLLHHAYGNSASLIVVGGYGHTRLRELIMGGVTRHLIKESEIPVLFSH